MPKFSEEQMIEITRIKERLENFLNKVQPYPPLPQPTEELPYKVRGLTNEEHDEFQQLKANFLYLDKKFNNIEKEVKPLLHKKKSKYKEYSVTNPPPPGYI